MTFTIRTSALAIGALLLGSAIFAQTEKKAIYPEPDLAQAEITAALIKANSEHKRVILDFGGNWCGDCRALDTYFHREPNAALLKANFILVAVNIGRYDKNKDIAKKYEVPL